jgi:predicted ThiF/HesA family dinucleotide-utilizing enzyme
MHPRMGVVMCSLILARVPYIRNFNRITPLFFDHTSDISVPENIRVLLRNHTGCIVRLILA